MYNKENIISDLYNALEKLRYPEVAQINYEEFEVTILAGNKRVELLHWLLQENQNFNFSMLNKFKESSLEGKLFKCYSQMGFCTSEDVLLGKCKIDEQLHFLSLLTLFVTRMYSVESESLEDGKETFNSLLKLDIVNVSPKIDCSSKERSNSKRDTTFHNESKSSEISSNAINKQRKDFENMCSNVKLNLEESNKQQNSHYELKMQKFYTSFKNTTNLPIKKAHFNKSSDDYHDLNTDIEQIHATFSTVNKALINEVEFNNRLVPVTTENTAKPLSLVINNNVVLIEQACNMFKDN